MDRDTTCVLLCPCVSNKNRSRGLTMYKVSRGWVTGGDGANLRATTLFFLSYLCCVNGRQGSDGMRPAGKSWRLVTDLEGSRRQIRRSTQAISGWRVRNARLWGERVGSQTLSAAEQQASRLNRKSGTAIHTDISSSRAVSSFQLSVPSRW